MLYEPKSTAYKTASKLTQLAFRLERFAFSRLVY
jgi:hypothetical protein